MRWAAGLLLAGTALGQEARVTFQYERVGLATPRYSMVVGESGTVKYRAENAPPKAAGAEDGVPAPPVEKTVGLSAGTAGKIFELARTADRFKVECASEAKNIAFTGKKTLSYAGPDGAGECTFNYSEVKPVAALTDMFQAIEATLESGRRMEFKRRFDRLGLDAEMITLGTLIEGHQASDLETIAPTLRLIANDTELLERVRSRAAAMLRQADAVR